MAETKVHESWRGEDMQADKLPLSGAADLPGAFTTIVREYEQPLFVFLTEILTDRERARELLQDTFLDAWRSFQRGIAPFAETCEPIEVRRWLFHVAYHRAVSVLRRRRLIHWESLERSFLSDLNAVRDTRSFEDALAEHDLLEHALAYLSPEDVACLLLATVHGFTAVETAEIMKASPQAIAKRISRARHRLMAAYLKEYASTQKDEGS